MQFNLDNFFYPTSLALIGASQKEKSIGYELLKSIRTYNFTGKVYPVNPNADVVLNYPCYKDIPQLPDNIDLAIIAVPKQFVYSSIEELINKGVKYFILITAGFKEVGTEGELAELTLVDMVRSAGGRLIGPNCMGIINTLTGTKLNATFVAEKPETGAIGFLSQSGALGAAVLNSLRETDIRFSHFVSVGNKGDISELDLLHYWNNDDNIRILSFYLESFVDGYKFIEPFVKNRITKPVLILKGGKTEGGIKAAASHTGALGNNDKVVTSLLKQFKIIRADSVNSLFNSAKGFDNFPLPKGNRVAIVTNAGGPAILTADALEKNGLTLANLTVLTKEKLKEIVHKEGSVNNPVDLLPGGTATQFESVNRLLLDDENVDAVISIFVEPVMVNAMPVIEGINSIESGKPLLQVVMPLPEFWNDYRLNSVTGKPLFRTPEDPAEVLGNLLFFTREKRDYLLSDSITAPFSGEDRFLSFDELKELSERYSFPMVNSRLVKGDQLNPDKTGIAFPLVVKGISDEVVHKTEFDAVKLNIKDVNGLKSAVDEIKSSFKPHNLTPDYYLLQEYHKPAHELLIGGFRDPSFGPVIMFGTGGKYVEVLNDTGLRSAHIAEEDINEMIGETKIGLILKGVRGEKPADLDKLKAIIRAAAKMMLDYPQIKEFDFNPLLLTKEGKYILVDVRVKI